MNESDKKWKCSDCGEIIINSEILSAKNPFDLEAMIQGCPECTSVMGFDRVCDEPGCEELATCGFPTKNGYRHTCGEHSEI